MSDVLNRLMNPFLTPATLAMTLWGEGPNAWIPKKHLTYASARIAHAVRRGNGRIIISMPPRHGKSMLISQSTIPWFLENFPGVGENVMFITYNDDFACEWGMKAKDLIIERNDLFSFKIRSDRSRVDRFETNRGNICWFGGINGGQTGKGAKLIIIDDYIKGIEDAMSPTMRAKTYMNFVSNIDTRTEPGASIIILATRWWSDDLIGMILKHLKGWENICFPALATAEYCNLPGGVDIIGRRVGEPLFPERFDVERIEEWRSSMKVSGTIFEALMQQVPVDDQTNFTDSSWLRICGYDEVPNDVRWVRAWDFASTQGGGDWTTGTKMGRSGRTRRAYISDIAREQISPLKIEELIRRVAVKDGHEVPIILEVEGGSQAKGLVEHYRRNVLEGFKVIFAPAGNKSKMLKAQPFIAGVESGNVFLVSRRSNMEIVGLPVSGWHKTFYDEFDGFSLKTSKHDDQIDTASMCYNELFKDSIVDIAWGRDEEVYDSFSNLKKFGVRKVTATSEENLDSAYGSGNRKSGKIFKGLVW